MGRPVCVYKIKFTYLFVRNFIHSNGGNVIVIINFAKMNKSREVLYVRRYGFFSLL